MALAPYLLKTNVPLNISVLCLNTEQREVINHPFCVAEHLLQKLRNVLDIHRSWRDEQRLINKCCAHIHKRILFISKSHSVWCVGGQLLPFVISLQLECEFIWMLDFI